ncbi:MAG: hypothetical protein WC773_00835 [Patescibacteria group bacterium]|jgi:hypothetical protein
MNPLKREVDAIRARDWRLLFGIGCVGAWINCAMCVCHSKYGPATLLFVVGAVAGWLGMTARDEDNPVHTTPK